MMDNRTERSSNTQARDNKLGEKQRGAWKKQLQEGKRQGKEERRKSLSNPDARIAMQSNRKMREGLTIEKGKKEKMVVKKG